MNVRKTAHSPEGLVAAASSRLMRMHEEVKGNQCEQQSLDNASSPP